MEIISIRSSLTDFAPSRLLMLSNRHALGLGSQDGLLTKCAHVTFVMMLLNLPEILKDEQSYDQFLESVACAFPELSHSLIQICSINTRRNIVLG